MPPLRKPRLFAIALVLLVLVGLGWASLAPVEAASRDAVFEIPRGTSAHRLAGEKLDVFPQTIRLTLGLKDVLVLRNADDVPHIFGTTRYATMFGQGYATAEDRLFLMDVLRHVGRARMSEFLGASPGNVHMDQEQLAVAPYLEADLTAQVNALAGAGVEGQAVHDDAQAYIDGVNAYVTETLSDATKLPAEYPALQQLPQPFKLEDVVAVASLVGGIFGKGGGGELSNFCGLQRHPRRTRDYSGDAEAGSHHDGPLSHRKKEVVIQNEGKSKCSRTRPGPVWARAQSC